MIVTETIPSIMLTYYMTKDSKKKMKRLKKIQKAYENMYAHEDGFAGRGGAVKIDEKGLTTPRKDKRIRIDLRRSESEQYSDY